MDILSLRKRAARSVHIALVARNWLFGWFIVEYEQRGEDRAEYGGKLLKNLLRTMTKRAGKGFSERSLELYRKFYFSYEEISRTLSAKLSVYGTEGGMMIKKSHFRSLKSYVPIRGL